MSTPRFGIVCSCFNKTFTEPLLRSACEALHEYPHDEVRVPGAFEIPLQVQRMARSGKYAAIIALGVVWQGETLHAAEIMRAVTDNLMRISLENDIPVIHEVLSVSNEAEARARTMGVYHNRGMEAVESALNVLGLPSKAPKSTQSKTQTKPKRRSEKKASTE